ncbi:hypothetical protein ACFL0G_05110 [Candidatus Zixiibacteriota bacterium]
MRTILTFALTIICLMLVWGCEETVTKIQTVEQSELNPPLGLRSITGDGQVTLRWYSSNYEEDFGGYIIYQATGNHQQLAPETLPVAFAAIETLVVFSGSPPTVHTVVGLDDGTTYSFALTTTDTDISKESYPSNIVADTPRPFGTAKIYQQESSENSGFDFSEEVTVSYNSSDCDIFLDVYTITDNLHFSLTSPDQADPTLRTTMIQDMGYTESFDTIDISPIQGWDPDYSVDVLDMTDHTFALKTEDNNYVKLRILSTGGASPDQWVEFEYGYQTISGDPNFKVTP